MEQIIDSPKSVVIKYESGKQIILGQNEATQILSLYFQQRKETGDLIGEIKLEEPKKSIFKRLDDYIYKFFKK